MTQKPWIGFPTKSKTVIMNDIAACLAGGRNKLMASVAYNKYNVEQLVDTALEIMTPQTEINVKKEEVRGWSTKMGGKIAIKVPYSNAGMFYIRI